VAASDDPAPGRRRARIAVTLPVVVAVVAVIGFAVPSLHRRSAPQCVTGPPGAALVNTLLAARDRWLLHGGPVPPLSGRPETLRDRMRGVPVTAWTSSVVGFEPGGMLRTRVALRYRLAGDSVDTVRQRVVGVATGGGCWVLRDDDPAPGAVPDLWDLGPVRVERTPQAVVIASAALDDGAARDLAADTSRAADAVAAVWPPGPRRPVVVLAPRRADDAAAVAGTPQAALDGLAAVTYGPPSPGAAGPSAFGDARVLVVPEAFAGLTPDGRRFVLAHELTHVATNAAARTRVPAWFQECFADAVGWSALGLDAARVDALVADDLRALRLTRLPARLPSRADFDPRGGDPARAYALADAACLALGGGRDAERITAVYRTAAGVPPAGSSTPSAASADAPSWDAPSSDAAAERALLAAAGTDEARLVEAWHRRVVDLVGPIPGSSP
jgi:hypothetical protein